MSLRVSIAMATYQGGAWVEEQLESFARQTRLPDQLVVCDDASRDDTVAKIEAFAARAPFEVRLERNVRNLETTPNFAKAVALTDGDVVFFADQDDVWRPEKIELLAGRFEADPELGAAFSNGRVVDGALAPLGYTLWDSLWFSPSERARVRAGYAPEIFARHVVAAGTTLAFRGLHRELVCPFPDLHDCHDAWVSFVISCVAKVDIVERDLIDYRLHGENQFGLKRFGWLEQLGKARWQLEQRIFEHNLRFFRAARERLGDAVTPGTRALIDERIAHAKRRDAMSRHLWRRLPDVAAELASGRYWRFAYGLRSVAQDLLLR